MMKIIMSPEVHKCSRVMITEIVPKTGTSAVSLHRSFLQSTMVSLTATAVVLATLCVYFSPVSSAGEEEYSACRKVLAATMKRQLETFSICMNEMEFKSRKDRSNKLHCIFKCLAIKEGLLGKDGHVDRQTIREFIDREVPDAMRPKAVDIMETCIDIGYGKVDPKEEYCKSYAPLIKCCIDAINKFCEDLKPDVVKE